MSLLRLQGSDGRVHEVFVEWDDGRAQWHWVGLEFDFWAYPIAGGHLADDLNAPTVCFQAEVCRAGDASRFEATISIVCPSSGHLSHDIFASSALRQLTRYWDVFGELEEG